MNQVKKKSRKIVRNIFLKCLEHYKNYFFLIMIFLKGDHITELYKYVCVRVFISPHQIFTNVLTYKLFGIEYLCSLCTVNINVEGQATKRASYTNSGHY